MDLLDPSALLLILIAPCVGAFIGVLVDRLPRGESVVHPRSACRACGGMLGVRDLIPVVSFALARGRCRRCSAAIPPELLYLEIIATGLACIALAAMPNVLLAWISAGVWWVLLALAACDLRWFRLPDPLTLTLLGLGSALSLADLGVPPGQAFWGAVAGAGSFAALRWGYRALRGREGLGLGDVKLMAGLGALIGPFDLPLMVLLAALAALAAAVTGAVLNHRGALAATRPLPFGAALAAAGGLMWLIRHLPV